APSPGPARAAFAQPMRRPVRSPQFLRRGGRPRASGAWRTACSGGKRERRSVMTVLVESRATPARLLEGSRAAWTAMLAAIDRASATIHLEIYGFSDRGIGARFIGALNAAAARGV